MGIWAFAAFFLKSIINFLFSQTGAFVQMPVLQMPLGAAFRWHLRAFVLRTMGKTHMDLIKTSFLPTREDAVAHGAGI